MLFTEIPQQYNTNISKVTMSQCIQIQIICNAYYKAHKLGSNTCTAKQNPKNENKRIQISCKTNTQTNPLHGLRAIPSSNIVTLILIMSTTWWSDNV